MIALCLLTAPLVLGDKAKRAADEDLTRILESRLSQLKPPAPEYLLERGQPRVLPNATKDEVWRALIKVLIQNGLIVHADRQAGIMVAVTSLVTRGPGQATSQVTGDGAPLSNTISFYVTETGDGRVTIYLKADKPINRVIFDKLTIQLTAKTRWPYITKEKR